MPESSSNNKPELFSLIAQGDEAAFKKLFDQYENLIYGTALSYLKSPEWAKDVMQDIFLKLWLKREQLPSIEKPESFFFIMARNEVLNALRTKWHTSPLPEEYQDFLPSDILLPDVHLQIQQSEAILQQAVLGLPEQQRRIYMLTREHGLTHEEIALRLGINKTTVGNHATRALNNLREFLKNHKEHLIGIFF